MELDFAIIADGVSTRPDGKWDIYGAGWDMIQANATPVRHPKLTLALRVLLSHTELEMAHRVDVILQSADGDEIARATGQTEALSPNQREGIPTGRPVGLEVVLNFENVVFPTFGAYQLVLQWDGTELRTPIRLFVSNAQPEPLA